VVRQLARLPRVRGAVLVAADGFVIDAALPPSLALEPIAALAATLGRELELRAARSGGAAFETAVFSADDGALLIALTPVGFVVVLGEQHANVGALRAALGEAVVLLRGTWTGSDDARASRDAPDP
jgi:predicted regulator of Ras-like GTPase activity (Roadblock/LC7/MglB family)